MPQDFGLRHQSEGLRPQAGGIRAHDQVFRALRHIQSLSIHARYTGRNKKPWAHKPAYIIA